MTPVEYLAGRASTHARIRLLSRGMTADGVSVYLVEDGGTKVLQVSPRAFPNVVRQSIEKIDAARDALGDDLGGAIPVPLDQWEANGVSCAFFEELTPISGHRLGRFLQLYKIRLPVLAWLRQIAEIDRGPANDAELCLQALTQCPNETLRAVASSALDRLRGKHFAPSARVMHGDLTLGNLLLDPSRTRQFMVIDWRGSNVVGFPIFDLVTFAEAVGLPRRTLRAELVAHADRLHCDMQDTRSYLIAALGHIWLNLDQFPPERFFAMATSNLNTLNRALNG